jgi:flagellar basal-body rod modification protein FlgD
MNAINNTSAISTGANMTKPTSAPGILDKDGFLKLLVGQMTNQDPMDPKGGMDISQMAQFSMVEQLTSLVGTTQSLLEESKLTSVLGLVGRSVTYTDADGVAGQGVVERASMVGGSPSLTINGKSGIDPSNITEVS